MGWGDRWKDHSALVPSWNHCQPACLEMLETVVWPKIRSVSTRGYYWFAELSKSPPSSLQKLKDIVENYVDSMQEQEVIKATRNMIKGDKACREAAGGPFEFKLNKAQKKRAVED